MRGDVPLDSASTLIIVLLTLAALSFVALRAADVALPLLRRAVVRETLKEGSFTEAASQRLRLSREVYDDLVQILSMLAVSAAAALLLALLVREAWLGWLPRAGVVGAASLVLFSAGEMAQRLVVKLNMRSFVLFGTLIQLALWPSLSLPRLLRFGLPAADARVEPAPSVNGDATQERVEPSMGVEEKIADEPLEHHERAMIHAILHLDETPVREIMVPRVDVVTLDVLSTIEQAVPKMLESGHSRLPVYEESPDNVIGILYARDLLATTARGQNAATPAVRDLVRSCFFVPESKRVDEMLEEFQERRVHLAVVVDEYGGVAGIVTIEDLLEEIVGEIVDEFDREEPTVERKESGEVLVDARISIDEFNDEFKTDIVPQGFDTLGGLLFTRLGRIPSAGDEIDEAGLRFQVIATAGRRIKTVRVTIQPVEADADLAEDEAGRARVVHRGR
jgi:putative hemolysin